MKNGKCRCQCKNLKKHHVCEKNYFSNFSTCTCENDKYLGSISGDSVITCVEIIEVTKIVPTKAVPANFNKKKVTCKIENFYILLTFSLFTISLLIIVSIYSYFIKHWSGQEHLLPHHKNGNKWKEIDINNII